MDNLFEILIYLIIIFSFLSSFLKKKQPQKNVPSKGSSDNQDRNSSVNPPKTVKEEYDILNEIENMFKTERESSEKVSTEEKPGYNSSHYDSDWHKPVPEEHNHTDKWHTTTPSEHKPGDVWQRKSTLVESYKNKIDSKINREAEKFEQILKKRDLVKPKYTNELIADFANKENLRKFFIASEILGKPKALRR